MLRVGIVGCGNIFTMHATSCAHLENAELVAVCDIKRDRAEKAGKKYGANVYTDYKELIDKEKRYNWEKTHKHILDDFGDRG